MKIGYEIDASMFDYMGDEEIFQWIYTRRESCSGATICIVKLCPDVQKCDLALHGVFINIAAMTYADKVVVRCRDGDVVLKHFPDEFIDVAEPSIRLV